MCTHYSLTKSCGDTGNVEETLELAVSMCVCVCVYASSPYYLRVGTKYITPV